MAAQRGEAEKVKLLLIGESGVGKSCLLNRYAHNEFNHKFVATIG